MNTPIVRASLLLFFLIVPAFASAHEDSVACTMQYQPVCGTENGTYKTYGNGCTLGAAKAVYQHEGECTAAELAGKQEGTYLPPAHCTAWNDGCNSCGRNANGESFCTLMASMSEPRAGYCTLYEETETPDLPKPVPAPDTSVSSGVSAGASIQAPAGETAVAATATGAADKPAPGFFLRIWTSVATWFGNLF